MKQHKIIIILLNGSASPQSWVLEIAQDAYVIAADGGIKHAQKLDLVPDLWIGDFDSTSVELAKTYASIPKQEHPADKNKSDGELALDIAMSHNPEKIVLYGGLGGERSDHTFFNMLMAARYADVNPSIEFILTSETETAFPLHAGKSLRITRDFGEILSILGLTDLEGLSIEGVKWPLENTNVSLGSTHTLSNIITSEAAIKLSNGHGIAIVQRNK